MYKELEAMMVKRDVGRADIAKLLGLTYGTTCLRFKERPEFTLAEAFKIRDFVAPEMTLDELFPQPGDRPGT